MKEQHHLARHASHIAAGTLCSRILGYLRDMLVAHTFGAGLAADAFYAAYRIPNLFRRLLGEGSLSASFIPVFSEYVHAKSAEETQELVNAVFSVLIVLLAALTVTGMLAAPWLVRVMAYGFVDDPEKLSLTIDLTRLMFPFLFFICLAALMLGMLNTMNSFFIPAVAPASLSVAEIAFILGLAPALSAEYQIKGLAVSVIAGGLGQCLLQWPAITKLGLRLRWRWSPRHAGVQRIQHLMVPSMIGLSVDQVNAFVDTIVASFLIQGSITALYYANRVMQLPLAIFGLALSSVALPAMSKCMAQNNLPALKHTLNYSIRMIVFILIPSAVGLMVLGKPIVQVLFERGSFSHEATLLTTAALFYYAAGLPAYAIAKVAASAFYAQQETAVPVKVAFIAMIINALLNVALMRPMGVGGLALATAIASAVNAAILLALLRKRIGLLGARAVIMTAVKTIGASGMMGAVAWGVYGVVFAGKPHVGMPAAIIAGVLAFFLAATVLRIDERKPLLAILRRDRPTAIE